MDHMEDLEDHMDLWDMDHHIMDQWDMDHHHRMDQWDMDLMDIITGLILMFYAAKYIK